MYHQLQITQIIQETKDSKTFVLKSLDNTLNQYQAGQFLTLVFETPTGEKRRSYSLSSAPLLREAISITIKKVDNGEFSRSLLTHAQVGDVLLASGINGMFTLPKNLNQVEQFFFLAAGSGITPCFSLIKTLLHTTNKKIVLIYSNKNEEQTIFYNQLLQLQKAFPTQLTIQLLLSNNTSVYNSRLSNWLLQQLLKQLLQTEKSNALFYLCGPFEYMQMATITLLGASIPSSNIKKENFDSLPRKEKPLPPNTNAHSIILNIQGEKHVLSVQYPNSILAAAKKNNLAIPYSCEAGRCGSCAATCTKGKVWMAYNEVLLDEELAKGRILCCQAYPLNDEVEVII
jgi:ring-1,2-phenylacetyl-CoA epoxidase subunit PaaE